MKEEPQGELPHSGKRRHPGVFAGSSFALSEAESRPQAAVVADNSMHQKKTDISRCPFSFGAVDGT